MCVCFECDFGMTEVFLCTEPNEEFACPDTYGFVKVQDHKVYICGYICLCVCVRALTP